MTLEAALGFLTIIILLALIMTKRLSTLLALIVVPTVFALLGGAGGKVGTFIVNGIKSVSPTAAMFIFAILFFSILTDAGMFDPIINGLLKIVGRDPLKITVATALIAMLVHLDGSGAVTFTIAVPAMLPLFEELKMDKRVLTAAVGLAAGTMNMVPWGGPTLRAATALKAPITSVYNPVIVPQVAGLICVLVIAYMLGLRERKRLGVGDTSLTVVERALSPEQQQLRRPRLFWFNVVVTVVALVALVRAWQPPAVIFMIAFAITLLVNYPDPKIQMERVNAHAKSALLMASVLLAAGALVGIMQESKMLEAMSKSMVSILPPSLGRHLPLLMGILSMPLSLAFDPDSYYFGVLPVLAGTAEALGIPGVQVARASILGQMTVGFPLSPLTPATLLLVGLAGVDLGEHQKFSFKWAWLVSLVMVLVAAVIGAIPL